MRIDLSQHGLSDRSVDLQRFLDAQENTYDAALSELSSGRKSGHWMWFIFPQIRGLGRSRISSLYAIQSVTEAQEYLENKILRSRLVSCAEAVLLHRLRGPQEILGPVDSLKFQSSMTLFASVAPKEGIFFGCIEIFFCGQLDEKTLNILDDIERSSK